MNLVKCLFMMTFLGIFYITAYAQNLPIKCGLYQKSGWGRQTSASAMCVPYDWADGGGVYGVGGDMSLASIKNDFYVVLRDGILETEKVPCTGSCDIHVIDSTHFEITSMFKFICKWDKNPVYIQHYIYFENIGLDPCLPLEPEPGMPSLITIVNDLPRKEAHVLWSGNTDDTPEVLKICADGSSATKIRLINLDTNIPTSAISFEIDGQPDDIDPDACAQINIDEKNGNTIVAVLKHPGYIPSYVKGYFYDIDVNILYGQKIIKFPVQVYRAPVLMVHGLWSDRSAFQKMKERLTGDGYCPEELILAADYSNSNDASFATNSYVVPYYLDIILNICRLKGYSAGKADVIGHSMGGLLTRNYLQSEAYTGRQDIHKIITINTPHSGSQFANFLLDHNNPVSFVVGMGVETFTRFVYDASIDGGAVKDLAVNSNALNITNLERLNTSIVPTHTISTESHIKSDNWLSKILLAIGESPEYFVGNTVFYGQLNDLIVSVPSQSGGLEVPQNTLITGQVHLYSPDNDSVIKVVERAINTDPFNPFYFSQNGFAPVPQITPFKNAMINTPIDLIPGSIAITWPLRNQNYSQGSSVPVSFSSSNGINRIKFEAITLPDNVTLIDTAIAFGNVIYKIPQNAFGQVKFIAFGFDSDKLIGFDTLTIRVNMISTPDSITFPVEAIYLREKSTVPLSVTGWYKNDIQHEISQISDIRYIINDTAMAVVEQKNLIRGKKPGTTVLTVNYLNKSANIPVYVFSADTVASTVTAVHAPESIFKRMGSGNMGEINIYPNPSGGRFNIRIELIKNTTVALTVFDAFGKQILELLNDRLPEGICNINFDGGTFPSGVYYLQFRSENQVITRKLLLFK